MVVSLGIEKENKAVMVGKNIINNYEVKTARFSKTCRELNNFK